MRHSSDNVTDRYFAIIGAGVMPCFDERTLVIDRDVKPDARILVVTF
jgi:hypothetical protein